MVGRYRYSWYMGSLACAATLFLASLAMAQCDAGCSGDNFGTEYTGGTANYRSGQCQRFGGQWGHNLRQRVGHLSEIHKRDFARNQAWPRPFDCADRQLYFAMWDPMLEAGYRCNCVFTSAHFDPESNELNSAGRAKVQSIFQNNPVGQKVALVQNSGNGSVVDARLQNLQTTINRWYGADSFMDVALTEIAPLNFSGQRAEIINQLLIDRTPPPVIPVASGTGATSDINIAQ